MKLVYPLFLTLVLSNCTTKQERSVTYENTAVQQDKFIKEVIIRDTISIKKETAIINEDGSVTTNTVTQLREVMNSKSGKIDTIAKTITTNTNTIKTVWDQEKEEWIVVKL